MFVVCSRLMRVRRHGLTCFLHTVFALFTQESRLLRSFRPGFGEASQQNERRSLLRGCRLKMTDADIDRYVKQSRITYRSLVVFTALPIRSLWCRECSRRSTFSRAFS